MYQTKIPDYIDHKAMKEMKNFKKNFEKKSKIKKESSSSIRNDSKKSS